MAESIDKRVPLKNEGSKLGLKETTNVLIDEFEKQKKFWETMEQTIAHVASIYRALGFRDILSDNHVSQQELQDLWARKPTQYEKDYMGLALPYLMKMHPKELLVMFEQELGITAGNLPKTLADTTIEMKDGRVKTLQEVLISIGGNGKKGKDILLSVFLDDPESPQKIQ